MMMRGVWLLSLALFSSWVQAAIGISSSNFPDGLQSPFSGNAASKGVIYFGYNAQLLNNPDTVLAAKTVHRNSGSTVNTCNSAHCNASGTAAPTQDAGTFPPTVDYTATVDVPYQVNTSLAGNGTNQYKTINLNSQAQLTINNSGQSFYIDQLTLISASVLRLAPGDYWVRALTTGFQSQIQVQGSGLVRLFIMDDWTLGSSSLLNSPAINSSGTPGNLYVYSYGSVTLNNLATLSGYVYSAHSKGNNDAITLQSPSYVFGALSGENISLDTDARVNYRSPITPLGQQIDHFELTHASNALTCTPLSVTVKACLDSAVPCATPYTGTSPALSANLSPATWSGLNFSNGVASAQLTVRDTGTVRMNVGSSTPPLKAFAQTQCKSGSSAWGTGAACDVAFADSGFIFDVPTLLARKPQSDITLRAVRKNPTTQSCDPAFSSGTREILFTRSYINPTSNPYTDSADVLINDQVLAAAGSNVSLTFGSNAMAQLKVQYNDAGQITLDARYAPTNGAESGLVMTGSDLFVSKPVGLCVYSDSPNSDCADGNASCFKFVAAGDDFRLGVRGAAWEVDADANLCNNPTTPNYSQDGIVLDSVLVAPAGGASATLAITKVDIVATNLGEKMLTNQRISEVGVFTISATPVANEYFTETVGPGSSVNIGRFSPAYLDVVGSASLTPSCGSAFSYQGQQMGFATGQEPSLTVTGRNRAGGITTNYDRGDFWQLATPARDPYLSVTGKASLDIVGRLLVAGEVSLVQSGANSGDGAQTYRWSGETLEYTPAVLPTADDLPFTAAVRQDFAVAVLTDPDGACYLGETSSCQPFSYDFLSVAGSTVTPGSQVRLGRLRIGNAHGSELQALNLPLTLETWQSTAAGDNSFKLESQDNCSAAALGAPVLEDYSGQLVVGETTASVIGLAAGVGLLELTAPGAGNTGSVRVHFAGAPSPALAPTWLHYDWNGAGREAAQGTATFGIYRGPKPLIFRRELYR